MNGGKKWAKGFGVFGNFHDVRLLREPGDRPVHQGWWYKTDDEALIFQSPEQQPIELERDFWNKNSIISLEEGSFWLRLYWSSHSFISLFTVYSNCNWTSCLSVLRTLFTSLFSLSSSPPLPHPFSFLLLSSSIVLGHTTHIGHKFSM